MLPAANLSLSLFKGMYSPIRLMVHRRTMIQFAYWFNAARTLIGPTTEPFSRLDYICAIFIVDLSK